METGSAIAALGLLLGASVTSGLRLYATVAVLGYLGRTHVIALPPALSPLTHSWVITLSAALYLLEFCADKLPVFDSIWDAVHTFIRPPAAAILSFAALGAVSEPWRTMAALAAGGVTLSAHGLKAGARAALNTSPEPMTNWLASFGEDGATFLLLYVAVRHPAAAIAVAAAVVLAAALLAAWVIRSFRRFLAARRARAANRSAGATRA